MRPFSRYYWIHAPTLTSVSGGLKFPEVPKAREKWPRQLTKLVLQFTRIRLHLHLLCASVTSLVAVGSDALLSSLQSALTLRPQDRYTSKMFLRGDSVILVLKNPH